MHREHLHVLYKQVMCVLWSTTIRGSTHKFKSTTHLTATTKHPSMSTHINTQPTAMYNHLEHHIRRMHVIRPHRKKPNRTIPHIENTHSLYSHDFCHSAASSIKSSVWLCMFSQPNLQPTKLYHPSEQEAAVHAP